MKNKKENEEYISVIKRINTDTERFMRSFKE